MGTAGRVRANGGCFAAGPLHMLAHLRLPTTSSNSACKDSSRVGALGLYLSHLFAVLPLIAQLKAAGGKEREESKRRCWSERARAEILLQKST